MAVGVLLDIALLIGGYTVLGIVIAVICVVVGAIVRFTARNVIAWGVNAVATKSGERDGRAPAFLLVISRLQVGLSPFYGSRADG